MFETPGAANMTIDTLSRLAATFNTGLVIEFVPFSEMLGWENDFSQDAFDVVRLDRDREFLEGATRPRVRHRRKSRAVTLTIVSTLLGTNLPHSVAESSQLNLCFAETTPGVSGLSGMQGQIDGGQEIGSLNDLLSGGGIPDGRQSYAAAATNSNEERAVA